ncbi:HIT domain-containing protein [Parvibaculum sp.]|uniref:HIT domain-containing protein n=1 Tax=Parvibaculum sp. TaxID=2024848 RepID=UPI00320FFD30
MLKNWKIWIVVLAAFGIGQLDPIGEAYWKLAEWKLPQIKAESLSKPSPFEGIPHEKWIGESEHAFAVNDIHPVAPVHFLVIPKHRYTSILETPPEVVSEMVQLGLKLARERGITDSGFRIVINTNPQGSQTVYHLHMHFIGGRQMRDKG